MILAAGLSPAWQQIFVFDRVLPGEVNRASRSLACASGKVLNVARALHSLQATCHTVCVAGGVAGQALREDCRAGGLDVEWITAQAASRTCVTVIDSSTSITTELVENAPALTPDELEQFHAATLQAGSQATLAVFTGSLPAGAPPETWARLMQQLECPAVLDIRGAELTAALPHRPLVVKPNREELGSTLGEDLSSASDEQLFAAMARLVDEGARWVVISQGSGAVLICGRDSGESFEHWRCIPPVVSNPVNPIGCGDSLAAGMAHAIAGGAPVPQAVCTGVAAALVNLANLAPAVLDLPAVRQAATQVTLERLQ